MNNSIRTFRAASTEEAVSQIRREMGVDAVVLEVKQVTSRGLFGWLSSRRQVEVTASMPAASQRSQRSSASQSRTVTPTTAGTIASAAVRAATVSATSAAETPPKSPEARSPSNPVADGIALENSRGSMCLAERRNQLAIEAGAQLAQLAPPPPLLPELNFARDRMVSAITGTSPELATPQTIEQRLDALQQMIADLGRRAPSRSLVEIPPEMFPHYLTLVEADVPDELARELIQKLVLHVAPGQLADTAVTMASLTAMIEQQIPCARAIAPQAGRRQIAIVVGPTGVGKTTTLAKLAGQLGVQQGYRLGLITVDTYRVAAVEQLRTYADIINLPMKIVANAAEMHEALDAFVDCDLVLIDTAGRSPHDDRKLDELKQLIEAASPDHIFLVLSLASGANALRNAADRFAAVRPTSLVLTKLDEAVGCGGLLSASRDIGLPISYFTTGQEVPRDLEPANPCRAARLIIGTETVQQPRLP